MNKKITLALAAAFVSFGAFAQAPQGPVPFEGPDHQAPECFNDCQGLTPTQKANKQTLKMTKDLDLNAEQQKKIGKLNLKNAKKHEANKQKAEKARAKKQAKRSKQMEKNEKKLKKILTADQYNKLQMQREEKAKKHNEGGKHEFHKDGKMEGRHHMGPRPENGQKPAPKPQNAPEAK